MFLSSFHHFFTRYPCHFRSVAYMYLILGHQTQIAVRHFLEHFLVGQMQIFHERCNLPEETVVSYGLGFAINIFTFFAKVDSTAKFCIPIISMETLIALTNSLNVPFLRSSSSPSSPCMNHDTALATLSIDRSSAT